MTLAFLLYLEYSGMVPLLRTVRIKWLIYIYIHICIYVHTHMYTHTHIYVHTHIYIKYLELYLTHSTSELIWHLHCLKPICISFYLSCPPHHVSWVVFYGEPSEMPPPQNISSKVPSTQISFSQKATLSSSSLP